MAVGGSPVAGELKCLQVYGGEFAQGVRGVLAEGDQAGNLTSAYVGGRGSKRQH
jgi:hypothetical protein